MDEKHTRQNIELKKPVVQSVFIVFVMSFHLYFDKQAHKKLEKRRKKQNKTKIKSLNFAESNARGSFETYNLFCSLRLEEFGQFYKRHGGTLIKLGKYLPFSSKILIISSNSVLVQFCPTERNTLPRSLERMISSLSLTSNALKAFFNSVSKEKRHRPFHNV